MKGKMNEEQLNKAWTVYGMIVISLFFIIIIGGVTDSILISHAENYDVMELKICNDLKILSSEYSKITAVDYHIKYYKDECVVYVNKIEYNGHEFIRLVGLEQISILDALVNNEVKKE